MIKRTITVEIECFNLNGDEIFATKADELIDILADQIMHLRISLNGAVASVRSVRDTETKSMN